MAFRSPPVTVFMDGFADGVAAYNDAKGTSVQLLGWDKATQNGLLHAVLRRPGAGQAAGAAVHLAGRRHHHARRRPRGPGRRGGRHRRTATPCIIGVDSDWYEANPDYSSIVLTSVMKEIGAAVEQAITDSVSGKFTPEPYVGTLANGGVSIAPFHDFDSTGLLTSIKAGSGASSQRRSSRVKLTIESQNAPK